MKMNKLYIFLAVILASFASTACFDDPGADTLWNGLEVEFQDANLPNGLTRNLIRANPTQTDEVNLQVNLVGPAQTSPVNVSIVVDPASTAVEGVHYNLSTNSVTIPAGQNTVNFPVTVLTGNIDPAETPDLILQISTVSGAKISTNYDDVTLKIRVVCPSNISTAADTWQATSESRFGTFQSMVKVTPLPAAGRYVVSDISAGLYAAFGFSDTQEVIFSDNCGVLSYVGRRQVEFNISPPRVEPLQGQYNEETETFTLYWSDPGNNIDGKTTFVKQ